MNIVGYHTTIKPRMMSVIAALQMGLEALELVWSSSANI
jgi:hypothetical protein